MFGGLLDLKELSVSDVMVHRTKMVAVNAELPPRELVREVLASPYTRLPLWRGEPENIIGVMHAKDLLRELESVGDPDKVSIDDIALDAWFVPETTTLVDQLQAFRKRKTHFALVVDEYGVVMGLVTLEDILEEIVGEIADEFDLDADHQIKPAEGGDYVVDGAMTIRDLNRATDWSLPDDEANTVAGLVIHEAQMIPAEGQVFSFHGFRFEVLNRKDNRITRLKIRPL